MRSLCYALVLTLAAILVVGGCAQPTAPSTTTNGAAGEGEGAGGEGEGASSGAEGEGAASEGEGASSEGEGEGEGALVSGVLVGGGGASPGGIGGVRYVTDASATIATTSDDGSFTAPAGGTVTFFVANLTLGSAPMAAQISPWQLAGSCAHTPALDNVLVVLQSLDDDADPSTGTHLAAFADLDASARVDVRSLSLADVDAQIAALGKTAVDPSVALDVFMRQMDDESWSELSHDTFTGLDALGRGQGVATDGVNWFFSGWSLEGVGAVSKTDLQFNTLSSAPIPAAQVLADKTDHMGDIDVYDGHVYAPLEDGHDNYQHPTVMLVDDQSLDYGDKFAISTSLQSAGVPWVAVDPARGFAYLAEWDPTPAIHRFDLATFAYVDDLALVPPAGLTIARIQGAKVLGRALYLSTDDATKGIYKVDLETGTVLHLFDMSGVSEEEGLCFWQQPDGSLLHTLNVGANSVTAELHHHARTRGPLADALCR